VNADLRLAALEALTADRAACRAHAERYSWRACAETFLSHLVPIAGTPEASPLEDLPPEGLPAAD
jgi:hypothetical protein